MENYERTIDLAHVWNYIVCNTKKIIIGTLAVMIIAAALVFGKSALMPSEELYYSTSKVLFKFNSWSTTEKEYDFEDWNLIGAENLTNESNFAFMTNSKNIFTSDKLMLNVMNTYDIQEKIVDFKKKINITPIPGTDIVCFTVMADSPELAEEILAKVLNDGLTIAKNIYELKWEIIDSHTNNEESFSKITVTDEGKVETSSVFVDNIKLIILISVGGLGLFVACYVLKCIFNDKVESVELIEEGFEVPVLQAIPLNATDYDIVTTKIINSEGKTVLFTSIQKEEKIGSDIVLISKKLIERNKKVLIICVGRSDSVSRLEISNLNDGINSVDNIDLVVSEVKNISNIINKYQNNYDLLLIESNCLDNSSDALLMSKMVDFTVLVTGCNCVNIDKFNRKVKDFKNYSSGINGVILKNVTKESSSYKYI